jgi:hypothetical protein
VIARRATGRWASIIMKSDVPFLDPRQPLRAADIDV